MFRQVSNYETACQITLGIQFTGCQTTGNPNEGGLFGWSESKAIKRQTMLENHSGSLHLQAKEERGLTDNNLRIKQGLNKEISALDTRLGRLENENKNLQTQLIKLRKNKHVQTGTFKNLEDELDKLQQTIDLHQNTSKYNIDNRQGHLKNVETANQKYKEAILFLLKY